MKKKSTLLCQGKGNLQELMASTNAKTRPWHCRAIASSFSAGGKNRKLFLPNKCDILWGCAHVLYFSSDPCCLYSYKQGRTTGIQGELRAVLAMSAGARGCSQASPHCCTGGKCLPCHTLATALPCKISDGDKGLGQPYAMWGSFSAYVKASLFLSW